MSSKSASQRRKSAHKGSPSAYQGPASKKAAPVVVKKQHGGLLTAAIVIMAIHAVFNVVALISLRKAEYLNAPPWLYGTAILVGLATIISAIALWYWKRWGLYLYLVATIASMVLGVIVFATGYAAIYNILPLAILGWILNSQRKMQLLT